MVAYAFPFLARTERELCAHDQPEQSQPVVCCEPSAALPPCFSTSEHGDREGERRHREGKILPAGEVHQQPHSPAQRFRNTRRLVSHQQS